MTLNARLQSCAQRLTPLSVASNSGSRHSTSWHRVTYAMHVTSTILTVAPVPPWWRRVIDVIVNLSCRTHCGWPSRRRPYQCSREREREPTQVRSDLYRRETGTNPILIRIPRNFRALYEISSMHLRTVTSAFDFQFRSIIFRLILIECSHERIRQICLSDFVQIYHRYLAMCTVKRTDIGYEKKVSSTSDWPMISVWSFSYFRLLLLFPEREC